MQTLISDILKQKNNVIHTVEIGKSVVDVVQLMTEHGIGSVLISQNDKVVGIVSERDLARRCVHADVDITRTPVEAIMHTPVPFVTASSTIMQALTIMNETDRRHLPVYDDQKLVGVVSLSDVSRWLTRELETKVEYLESYIRGY